MLNNKYFIDQACSVKMAQWMLASVDVSLVPFLGFYGPQLRLGPWKRKKKKKELDQYLAILTAR